MPEKKTYSKLNICLLLVLAGTALKLIFFGSNVDEGYAIELAYRIAHGDLMITQMWEPHQTSAILGALFVKIYWIFTGGSNTGIVLYMHVLGIAIQMLVAYFLYRVVRLFTEPQISFLLACIYALSFPKGVIAPEYSNMQNWFMTLSALLFVLALYKNQLRFLVLSGFTLAGAVFSYPSMIILYPVMIVMLLWFGRRNQQNRLEFSYGNLKGVCAITLPCILLGGLFILIVLSYCSLPELIEGIGYILNDGSHSAGLLSRLSGIAYYFITILLRCAVCVLAGIIAARVLSKNQFWLALLISIVVQIFYWLLRDEFVNQPQTEMVLMTLVGIVICMKNHRDKMKPEEKPAYLEMILLTFSITGFLATVLLSNFKLIELVVYLCLAAIGGVLCLYHKSGTTEKFAKVVLVIWILSLSFGRIWVTSQGGELHTTPFEVANIQKSGPGIGIFTNYMTGYRYNTVADEWDDLVKDGESVLYVGPSSYYYMLGDVVISAPNTISTPSYDETLLTYWEKNSERYPDVVLVESCYGELVYPSDSFIINWLDTQYQAATVTELEYLRVYRK